MKRLYQIDALKGIAIISVLIMHSMPRDALSASCAAYHIGQAVPIFMVLMGFAAMQSFDARGIALIPYYKRRFTRLATPLAIVFAVSLALAILAHLPVNVGRETFIGVLPISGPGNYFITLLIEATLLMPFFYLAMKRVPKTTIALSFFISFLYELTAPHIGIFLRYPVLYASVFRYLPAIALGMWIASDYQISSGRNRFILLGTLASLAYITVSTFFGFRVTYFLPFWGTQNILSFFYPVLLTMIGLRFLPRSNLLEKLGRASYHIFLVQIVYFGAGLPLAMLWPIKTITDVTICIGLGLGLYSLRVSPQRIKSLA
ncbi:MAG: acyltransferase family protein [Candidatus Aquicultor sp.]